MLLKGLLYLVLSILPTVLAKTGFFNQNSFVDLILTRDIIKQTTIQFRSCRPGGALVRQGDQTNFATIGISSQGKLKLEITKGSNSYVKESDELVTDDSWYTVELLTTDRNVVTFTLKNSAKTFLMNIVASASKNPWILNLALTGDAKFGSGLHGCMNSTAHAPFDDSSKVRTSQGVQWDQCPLDTTPSLCGCSTKPCKNGGTCINLASAKYRCDCLQLNVTLKDSSGNPTKYLTGFNGTDCEENIDECKYPDFCRNNGTCQDCNSADNFYTCKCPTNPRKPDWKWTTGQNCESLIDHCTGKPQDICRNGTCKAGPRGHLCECHAGFKGENCTINIDECEVAPCDHGSKCTDGINNYTCTCVNGTKGRNCEINIDDCSPNPCNSGKCIDKINAFDCNCTDTGFKGEKCEINIDDCATKPCQNGGKCNDMVKDYNCTCYDGYEGKDCQTDKVDCTPNVCNNGTCYEKSHRNNYGKNITGMPATFNYSTAAGKVCDCKPGYKGELCEIDIDECEAKPCKRGTCQDGPNMFTCTCPTGWTGKTCDEDVDECAAGNPCLNGGACKNEPGTYSCECLNNTAPLYGGRLCTVILTGCVNAVCQNGGLCRPAYNDSTKQHTHECICGHGFAGAKCEHATSMTFNGLANLELTLVSNLVNLAFSFRTNFNNVILAQTQNDDGSQYIIIELQHGKGHVTYKNESTAEVKVVSVGGAQGEFSDSKWWNLELSLKNNGMDVIISNGGKSYRGRQILTQAMTLKKLRVAKFANSDQLSTTKTAYTGCMRNMKINQELKLPKDLATAANKIIVGCDKKDVCSPNPCGAYDCQDLWTDYKCDCMRPSHGKDCKQVYPVVTLGLNGNPSLLSYDVTTQQAVTMETNTVVTFVTRVTRKDGFFMYLGQETTTSNFMSVEVKDGRFVTITKFGGQVARQNHQNLFNGAQYLVQISRTGCEVQMFATEVGKPGSRKSSDKQTIAGCTNTSKLTVKKIYVGGLPQGRRRRRKRAVTSNIDGNAYTTDQSYGGTVSDLKVGDLRLQLTSSTNTPPNTITPQSPVTGVTSGEKMNDNCKSLTTPCPSGSNCTDTWTGHSCDFCASKPCPENATCVGKTDGFSCSSPITLSGTQSLVYTPGTFAQSPDYSSHKIDKITLKFRTREKKDQNMFTKVRDAGNNWVIKTTSGGQVVFQVANIMATLNMDYSDGNWHSLEASVDANLKLNLKVDSKSALSTTSIEKKVLFNTIIIGNPYTGCLDNVRFGDYVLPVYDNETLKADTSKHKMSMTYTLDANYEKYKIGCHGDKNMCDQNQCQHQAPCVDIWNDYNCTCPAGYTGSRCELNVNDCKKDSCKFGICRDGDHKFICDCFPGYSGSSCQTMVNNCQPNPCANRATCKNLPNDFECACPDKFGGKKCDVKLDQTCAANPCKAGTCKDVKKTASGSTYDSFECTCPAGKEGPDCGTTVDYCKQQNVVCKNGGTCKNNATSLKAECQCLPGYAGAYCGEDVDECRTNPCKHGRCVSGVNKFTCLCQKGWQGDRCDEDVNECQSGLCQNGGVCQNLPGSYKCDCSTSGYLGWRGRHCDEDIPECTEVRPCRNGAKCVELKPLYRCECLKGYADKNCSTNIDECAAKPCKNGGKCIDGVGKYTCQCGNTGYKGDLCEEDIDECLIKDVCNGGNCTNLPGNFSCQCLSGFSGLTCAEAVRGEPQVNLALVLGPLVAIVILLFLIGVIVFLVMARGKRANRGVYSPSRHELSGSGVQMAGPWLKPPPEERLI